MRRDEKTGRDGADMFFFSLGAPPGDTIMKRFRLLIIFLPLCFPSDERRYKIQSRATTLSLTVADLVLFNCYLHDLARDVPAVLHSLKCATAEMEKLEKEKIVPPTTDKIPLLLVARDFDSGKKLNQSSVDAVVGA